MTDKKNRTFRLSEEVVTKIKELAEKENRSMNNYLETILKSHIEQHDEPKSKKKRGTQR